MAVAPRVRSGMRATYLSLQSLAGRLCYGTFLLVLGAVIGESSPFVGQDLAEIGGGANRVIRRSTPGHARHISR